jgi:hypothetical protein
MVSSMYLMYTSTYRYVLVCTRLYKVQTGIIVSVYRHCVPTDDSRTITLLVSEGSSRIKTAVPNAEFIQIVTTHDIVLSVPRLPKT